MQEIRTGNPGHNEQRTSQEITADALQSAFLVHLQSMVDYWTHLAPDAGLSGPEDIRSRLDGMVNSMLATLDGMTLGLPRFILAPNPSWRDHKASLEHGQDYWPDNTGIVVKADISGNLHDEFSSMTTCSQL